MLSKFNIGISALICVYCCCVTIGYYALKADYNELKAEALILRLENKNLKLELEKQNKTIEDMGKESGKFQDTIDGIRTQIETTTIEMEQMPSSDKPVASEQATEQSQSVEAFKWLLKQSGNSAVKF